jgi:hypothetical protein
VPAAAGEPALAAAIPPKPIPLPRIVVDPTVPPRAVAPPAAPLDAAEPDDEPEATAPTPDSALTAPPPAAQPAAAAAPATTGASLSLPELPSVASAVPAAPRASPPSPDPATAPPRPPPAAPFAPRLAPATASAVSGLPDTAGAARWLDDKLLWLGVPARTQYDGSAYAATNCGPAALGMILEAYGEKIATPELRDWVNELADSYAYDDGTALDHLATVARRANLKPIGLYDPRGYRSWTVDDVRAAVRQGYPVIALAVYRLLPWSGGLGGNLNHYVVISGLKGDDFLYNDSSFGGKGGRGLVITAEQLETAWATADLPRHAVAFGRQDGALLGAAAPLDLPRGNAGAPPLASRARANPPSGPGPTTVSSLGDPLASNQVDAGLAEAPPAATDDAALESAAAAPLIGRFPGPVATPRPVVPLLGGPLILAAPPVAVPAPADSQPAQPLASTDPAPPTDAPPGADPLPGYGSFAFVLGGVALLYLLLVAQPTRRRLNRPLP